MKRIEFEDGWMYVMDRCNNGYDAAEFVDLASAIEQIKHWAREHRIDAAVATRDARRYQRLVSA